MLKQMSLHKKRLLKRYDLCSTALVFLSSNSFFLSKATAVLRVSLLCAVFIESPVYPISILEGGTLLLG